MRRFSTPLTATALGLGLFIVVPAGAQITPTGQTTTTATTKSAGILDSTTSAGVAVVRDANRLIGAAVTTTGGPYGNIADLIVDATGQVQYVLVESRGQPGQFHPVPFSLLQFSSTGDVSVNVSAATLDTVTVDRNNLKSLTDRSFAAQLRAAFGANVARGFVRADGSATSNAASSGASTTATTTTGSNSKTSLAELRSQVFSLAGLLGGTITASDGAAGTISTVAINPDGSIAYAVGTNAAGTTRFALPFSQATLNANFNGLTSTVTIETLASILVPQGSLPTFADPNFASLLTVAFGRQGSATGFGIVGSAAGANSVAGAGDPDRGGKSAVASAGDPRRGGASAVGRPGDQAGTRMNAQDQSTAAARSRASGGASDQDQSTAAARSRASGGASDQDQSTAAARSRASGGASDLDQSTAAARMRASAGATGSQTGTGTTTSTTTGGLVNAPAVTPAATATTSQSELIQMRDLLNFRIQAQDGAFGRVSDVVFDRNGNVQFLMGSFQGQTFPLPFSAASFSTTTANTLQFDATIAQMQQLAIDPNNLPSLSDPVFLQGMRDVFGNSFGANASQTTSAYTPPTTDPGQTPVPGRDAPRPRSASDRDPVDSTPSPGAGIDRTLGNANSGTGSSQASVKDPTGKTLMNNSRTGANQTGANQSTPTQRNWTWPNNPSFRTGTTGSRPIQPGDVGVGPKLPPGATPHPNPRTMQRSGPGTGTNGTGSGANSSSAIKPGDVGVGPKLPPGAKPHPNPRTMDRSGANSKKTDSGSTGSGTSGSGSTGSSSGSGSSGGSSGGSGS